MAPPVNLTQQYIQSQAPNPGGSGNPGGAYNTRRGPQYGARRGGPYNTFSGQQPFVGRYRPPTLTDEGGDPTSWNDYGGYSYNLPNNFGPYPGYGGAGQPGSEMGNFGYYGPRRQRQGQGRQPQYGGGGGHMNFDSQQELMDFYNQYNNRNPRGWPGGRDPLAADGALQPYDGPPGGYQVNPGWGSSGYDPSRTDGVVDPSYPGGMRYPNRPDGSSGAPRWRRGEFPPRTGVGIPDNEFLYTHQGQGFNWRDFNSGSPSGGGASLIQNEGSYVKPGPNGVAARPPAMAKPMPLPPEGDPNSGLGPQRPGTRMDPFRWRGRGGGY